ncbi:hypothetical protein [Terasakiella sp.]|uniref:hypothetical protein n=1 Tax=Terasakiella sp. TaxID=2034861 RepID=UPI003AA82180
MPNLRQYIFPNDDPVAPIVPIIGASGGPGGLVAFSPSVLQAARASETYLSDRAYIEKCLFPRLFKRCVDSAQNQQGEDDDSIASYEPPQWFDDALVRACTHDLPAFDVGRAQDLAHVLDGLQAKYLNPYADRPLMLALLIVVYAFKDLLDQGVVDLVEGSDFADCVDVLLLILNDDNLDRLRAGVDKSARKNALRLLKTLRGDGFFVKWKPENSTLGGGQ